MGANLSEAFYCIAQLAAALGVGRLNERDGCWEHQVDDHWWVAVNGHTEPQQCAKTGASVDPFHAVVIFNGWPAGILSPYGGVIAAGTVANEDAFIDALKAARDKAAAA